MKKLLILLTFLLPFISFSQDETKSEIENMTNLQKNIICFTINMHKDTTFFINRLYYDNRTYIEHFDDGTHVMVFYDGKIQMDAYFYEENLIAVNIFFNKKDIKSTIKFLNKYLFRVISKKYKYRWVCLNPKDCYVASIILIPKKKELNIESDK